MKAIYDFTLKDMRGKDVSLSDYQGKVPIAWTRLFRKNKKSINSGFNYLEYDPLIRR